MLERSAQILEFIASHKIQGEFNSTLIDTNGDYEKAKEEIASLKNTSQVMEATINTLGEGVSLDFSSTEVQNLTESECGMFKKDKLVWLGSTTMDPRTGEVYSDKADGNKISDIHQVMTKVGMDENADYRIGWKDSCVGGLSVL